MFVFLYFIRLTFSSCSQLTFSSTVAAVNLTAQSATISQVNTSAPYTSAYIRHRHPCISAGCEKAARCLSLLKYTSGLWIWKSITEPVNAILPPQRWNEGRLRCFPTAAPHSRVCCRLYILPPLLLLYTIVETTGNQLASSTPTTEFCTTQQRKIPSRGIVHLPVGDHSTHDGSTDPDTDFSCSTAA